MGDTKEHERHRREEAAKIRASQSGQSQTYTDSDGCEVTVTPTGAVFFNAADWW